MIDVANLQAKTHRTEGEHTANWLYISCVTVKVEQFEPACTLFSHIRADWRYRSNRSQQSDWDRNFFVTTCYIRKGMASESRKGSRSQPVLKREYDSAGLKPLHSVRQILKAWCRLCMQMITHASRVSLTSLSFLPLISYSGLSVHDTSPLRVLPRYIYALL